jgi:hypothetical protein
MNKLHASGLIETRVTPTIIPAFTAGSAEVDMVRSVRIEASGTSAVMTFVHAPQVALDEARIEHEAIGVNYLDIRTR